MTIQMGGGSHTIPMEGYFMLLPRIACAGHRSKDTKRAA